MRRQFKGRSGLYGWRWKGRVGCATIRGAVVVSEPNDRLILGI